MKILVVAHYQDDGSPTAIFIHEQMKEYVRAGHEVMALVPVGIAKRDWHGNRATVRARACWIDGIRHVFLRYLTLSRFGEKHFNTASAIFALKTQLTSVLDGFRPDVIHAHTLGFDSEIGAWLKTRFDCPVVVTTHGSDTNVPLDNGQAALLKTYCDQVDAVVAVSNQLKKRLETCGTRTPIHAIYNGYVPHPHPVDSIRNPLAMIQVGNLIESKRVDVTIRAFAKLREQWPDMTLTIIGQGSLRDSLEALCAQLGVSDGVRFLGQKPNAEVFHRMCESGFFVMASKPEGFGIVYLEAMAAGCVTIGTEGQGIADIIEHGVNGFLVPADDEDCIADVIRQCLLQPEMAQKVAVAGQTCAGQLTWSKNAGEYQKLFERLISEMAH